MRASRSNVLPAALLAVALLVPLGSGPAASQPACDDLGQTEGPDVIIGTEGPDVICGLGGDDQIEGLGGNDLIYGGPGFDTISGGTGGDYLHAGADGGALDGGPGTDVCVGETGTSCYPKSPPDPNDAKGILDVKKVDVGTGNMWSWRITTRGKWTLRRLWDDGYLIVYLDTRDNARSDYYLLARSTGHRLRGSLFRDRSGRDERLGSVKVHHPNIRSARFSFDLDRVKVEASRDYIRWSAQTILINASCSRGCFDRVTNEGPLTMPVD